MAVGAPPPNASWRDSARSSRLGPLNSSATFPVLLLMFNIKWWTLALTVITMIFLTVLSRFGFTIPVFCRWVRCLFAGRRRIATPWWM
jgi:intracellular multiplication protein IcmT